MNDAVKNNNYITTYTMVHTGKTTNSYYNHLMLISVMEFELVIYYILIGLGSILLMPFISLLTIWLSCKVIKLIKK